MSHPSTDLAAPPFRRCLYCMSYVEAMDVPAAAEDEWTVCDDCLARKREPGLWSRIEAANAAELAYLILLEIPQVSSPGTQQALRRLAQRRTELLQQTNQK